MYEKMAYAAEKNPIAAVQLLLLFFWFMRAFKFVMLKHRLN